MKCENPVVECFVSKEDNLDVFVFREKLSEQLVMLKEDNRKKDTKVATLTKQVERSAKQATQYQDIREELETVNEENTRLKKQSQLLERYKERVLTLEKVAERGKV